ncbi:MULTISPECIES: Lrp/AsnC ligand binding domain-containing protein [Paraglaciecola]|jgi:Lrp/AsnC family leucine-responsive transcriptional regulator|uniref:Leucine-responsive regulatory protein n=6 Tax=Paraglaciecola TaxID=1621534 RepID=K6YMK4_9ALTE|nr:MULTISPECIES: Lrp/AsnC ligand binding domain-containing protein [Paraglaciecola]AEE22990.1 transcriptional regulator, AsnC family [Glaciecola sp. 4H-3-7+YE-5]MAD14766.1 leucine-responsive transcriptional regulator [Alteromonadaceae bacterium]MBB20730.1 leucine-responsive transcriptional regulator [Rickettsiales bacterium]ABG40735.1 transcriptional regulator, AsnC family [Paraglaciecola sp. T6c]MBJ2137128.1 Lrp/AsnC ligand binding domain-containing protein [Paraglaciecola chathamensis]|tara:strand:+ start:5220 stop:5693 length:474 start_codon:yes stop_codon:yes gene_type:complete
MKKGQDTLDRTDLKILDILQRECRISNVELANQIHLSPTPCLERVRRLEKNGYIEKYVAHLNPKKLKANLTAYVQLSLASTSTESVKEFNQQVSEIDEIVECAMVAGQFDYLIKIRIENMDEYCKFLGSKLASIKGVTQTHTYVVMEEVKSTHLIQL